MAAALVRSFSDVDVVVVVLVGVVVGVGRLPAARYMAAQRTVAPKHPSSREREREREVLSYLGRADAVFRVCCASRIVCLINFFVKDDVSKLLTC